MATENKQEAEGGGVVEFIVGLMMDGHSDDAYEECLLQELGLNLESKEEEDVQLAETLFMLELVSTLFNFDAAANAKAKQTEKRIPQVLMENSAVINRLLLLRECLWDNQYEKFYSSINFQWPPTLETVFDCLVTSVRRSVRVLIGNAYTTIRLADCDKKLGLSASGIDVEQYLTSPPLNWTIDGVVVQPTPVQRSEQALDTKRLSQISDFILELENKG